MKTLNVDARGELIRRLRSVRPDTERRWGRMTAHQMICHLADVCRMAIGETPVRETSSALTRTIVKWMALYLPLRWRTGILTSPELDQCAGAGTRPGQFAADVADVEALLTTLSRRGATAKWPAHPVFGRLSHSQWMRWAYLHTDHHLRQFGAAEEHTPGKNTEQH
jgi:hypothetical protein